MYQMVYSCQFVPVAKYENRAATNANLPIINTTFVNVNSVLLLLNLSQPLHY